MTAQEPSAAPSASSASPASAPTAPAWSDQDLARDPHAQGDKHQRVQRMFAAISRSYDLNNRLHSFGLDQAWRRFTVAKSSLKPTDRVLDCACGTGDLTRLYAKGLAATGADANANNVIGTDFTPEMLDIARTKRDMPSDAGITYMTADAMALPFADASFDVVSIAFGIRNVQQPARAIAEFFRVLRPGGRLMVLEFDKPRNGLIRWGNDVYTKHIMPRTATLISRDRSGAYAYLPKSVETFLTRDQLQSLFRDAGFTSGEAWPLTFGVCVCHRAVKPG